MITVKKQKEKTVITFKEEVSIDNASEFKTALINGIKSSSEIHLNLEKNRLLHLSLIQIILSAKKEMDKLKKKLVVHDKNGALKISFSELGISGITDFVQKVEE